MAFSEPVTVSGTPTLTTSWGTLTYTSGSGSNVLTFKGAISDNASGSLNITGKSGTIKDLAGNSLSGSLNQTGLASLDASHSYTISCDLAGGSASNPTSYTYDSDDITLANPTRTGYVFAGWSGTGISGLTNSVTIAAHSHGDRAYTARWVSTWGLLQRQLNAGGTVTLTNDVAAMAGDSFLTVTKAVTLDLNGHVLTHNGQGEVLSVRPGGDLTLTNSLAAGAVTGGDHGVCVGSNAVFRLQGGAISGNAASYGGGVYVANGGTFTMTGGSISDNTADWAGGVFANGTCVMTGGTISGNAAECGGGGVYVSYGCGLTVSGRVVVSGNTNDVGAASNVYLDEGVIAVSNLTAGAYIGVATYPAPETNSPVTIATGALAGDEAHFFSDDPGCHVERDGSSLLLAVGSPAVFRDPQGQEIGDQAVVGWLSDNGFTQTDINNLGNDGTATDKLYECYRLNCDIRVRGAGGALTLAGIAVTNGVVSIRVQLERTAPLGIINGVLDLYGANDLAAGFGRSPIAKESISFGTGDPTFATNRTTGLVTQSVTATFSVSDVSSKFFKAVIEVSDPNEPEE